MKTITTDGNGAAAYISYAFSELAIIYPITPSSPMAELADIWATEDKPNLFGQTPKVVQMQSESGVAGALHGALTCGGLATTYTCSQGLLLMIPDMYKIAGELLPCVIHVSARAIATHALSIFGDHQDVMACRQTGFAMLAASSVQEAHDMALAAHLTTLKTSVPFVHFFDGFRTSHETTKIEVLEYEELRPLIHPALIENFRARALSPEQPVQRGTAQNPDVYFQNRERANGRYLDLPNALEEVFDQIAVLTGRRYRPFDYFGAEDAEEVLVAIGSSCSTIEETVEKLNAEGRKVGLIKVRLYRPFSANAFLSVLPKTCKTLGVLDRTKESGALGEPLYLDICAALQEKGAKHIRVYGGRYGLGLKEFTPTHVYAAFENLRSSTPKNHFTVGICDDITHTSLPISKPYHVEKTDCVSCKFYGLGSDGTVGANKNSIKIIGDNTDLFVQAYFCYDSKKSGGITTSHLRFGQSEIKSAYLIERADFVACHNPSYLTRYDMVSDLKDGGVFLINCPWTTAEDLSQRIPASLKRQLFAKRISLFVIDGTKIANETGLGGRTGTIMQAAFFLLNERIMPYARALEFLKAEITAKFSKKGERVVASNLAALARVQDNLQKIDLPASWQNATDGADVRTQPNDEYYRSFIHPILSLRGDELPVSAFSEDGSVPTGTTRLEKHGVARALPKWIPENCIQCNQCSFVCPHACIRPFVCDENADLPQAFITRPAVGLQGKRFRVQVAAHDCMGCGVCAEVCPAKNKALVMTPSEEISKAEGANWEFALSLPKADTSAFKETTVKGSQFNKPLFEFSYACSGCGETPYIKVLTQLFGEKTVIANATGCSSIYGGSSPTCPYTVNKNGHGPAWANSLFEDNAEFGLGMRLALNARKITPSDTAVWIIGGDGWAYDIGFNGLDHALSTGENVKVLVLDSEVYSNTGGQASKATPKGAVARFATAGKRLRKKDLGLMMMSYGNVYVAQVSMGANKQQLLTALGEAAQYDGPALIIAYSTCIAHGFDMCNSMREQKLAVDSGYWQLYRYNPLLRGQGKNPLVLDSHADTALFREFLGGENRFAVLKKTHPDEAEQLFTLAEEECKKRQKLYQALASMEL